MGTGFPSRVRSVAGAAARPAGSWKQPSLNAHRCQEAPASNTRRAGPGKGEKQREALLWRGPLRLSQTGPPLAARTLPEAHYGPAGTGGAHTQVSARSERAASEGPALPAAAGAATAPCSPGHGARPEPRAATGGGLPREPRRRPAARKPPGLCPCPGPGRAPDPAPVPQPRTPDSDSQTPPATPSSGPAPCLAPRPPTPRAGPAPGPAPQSSGTTFAPAPRRSPSRPPGRAARCPI